MNGQILWGVGLTKILSNTVTKHTIKSLPYLILKRIEFWLTVNFQVQVKILLCRRTNQCILLILKEGSGTWNWPVTTAVHNFLVVKYPRTDELGLGKWKEEGNATCCQLVLSEGRPCLDRRLWQRLSTTTCAKLAFSNYNLGTPGKVSLEYSFLKFQPRFTTDGNFELIHYWTLRSTEYSERAQQKFSVPQFIQTVIADSLGNGKLWIVIIIHITV